jgi:phosphatidate cytidylyltransferase
MTTEVCQRLIGISHAFDQPITVWLCGAILISVVGMGVAIVGLGKSRLLVESEYADALARWKSWVLLAGCILMPVLLGAAFTIAAVTLLSLVCYREFARTTGVFRHYRISVAVVAGILLANFAALDHFDRLFFASAFFVVALIAIITIPQDQPQGYIQRVALGCFGFLLFGFSLAYIGNIANSVNYRPVLLLMFLSVSLNDIFNYGIGRVFGRRKLLPMTNPRKTVEGALGAMLLTTLMVTVLGHQVFYQSAVDNWVSLASLGLLISVLGQMGDLVLSSIKRDVGFKDTTTILSGHGGLLARFDSLVLVPPAVYHFLSLHLGPLGASEPARILTGGG